MPDLFEGHVRQAPPLGNGFDLLQDVLLRSASHVDVVAVARGVVAGDGFPEIFSTVVS